MGVFLILVRYLKNSNAYRNPKHKVIIVQKPQGSLWFQFVHFDRNTFFGVSFSYKKHPNLDAALDIVRVCLFLVSGFDQTGEQ